MSKESSIAPKERINIKYVPATGGQQEEIELPLNLLVVGDFTGQNDDTPIEERKAVSIDKNNFNAVLEKANVSLNFNVPNKLTDEDTDLNVKIDIQNMKDFSPDAIAKNVPELKKLIELREALVALKSPLGNVPAFRNRLQELLKDENAREQLLKELNMLNQG